MVPSRHEVRSQRVKGSGKGGRASRQHLTCMLPIISWYRFTTASILAKGSGRGQEERCQRGLTVPPTARPPISPLTHRQDTDQTGQFQTPCHRKDRAVRGRSCWGPERQKVAMGGRDGVGGDLFPHSLHAWEGLFCPSSPHLPLLSLHSAPLQGFRTF